MTACFCAVVRFASDPAASVVVLEGAVAVLVGEVAASVVVVTVLLTVSVCVLLTVVVWVVVEPDPPPPATAPTMKPITIPANHFQFRRHHGGFFGDAPGGAGAPGDAEGSVGSPGPTDIFGQTVELD